MSIKRNLLTFSLSLIYLMMVAFQVDAAAGSGRGEVLIIPVSGFTDSTVVSPVGGNYYTTIGEQRLEIFKRAAFIWSNILDLNYDIKVTANFKALTCSSGSAMLGQAGPDRVKKIDNVWYPTSLANQLLVADTSGAYDDMHMTFNSSIDNGCYNGSPGGWYYGLDGNNPANKQDLLSVAIHELAHGLGFLSFVSSSGVLFNGAIDAYSRNLKDYNTGVNWTDMTDAERQASGQSNLLFWDGTHGNTFADTVFDSHAGYIAGEIRMFSPLSFLSGSSVSHIATFAAPNQLMEPYATETARLPSIEPYMFKDIGYEIKSEDSSQNIPTIDNYTLNVAINGSVALNAMSHSFDLDGDTVTFHTFTDLPANGILSDLFSPNATYTPANNFTGTDTVKLKVYDSHFNLSAEGTVTINVGPVANAAPIASNDNYTINEDATATLFNVLTNDTDDVSLDTASISIVSAPANGTANISSGQIQYTPTANFNGSDTITYTVDDGAGDTSNVSIVTVTVTSVNDVPVVANNSYSLTTNSLNNDLNIIANDSDIDTPLNYGHVTIVSNVSHGSLNLSGSSLLYTPSTNYSGNDGFTYKLNDGTSDSTTATVALNIVAPNVVPVTANDSVTTAENVSVLIDFKANDTDDKVISSSDFVIDSPPSNGSIAEISSFMQYDPDTDFSGFDSFTYHIVDDDGAVSNVSTITVTVTHTNAAPTAINDSVTTNEDTSTLIYVLSNDSDPENDSLLYANLTIASQPDHGTVSIQSNGIQYSPSNNYHGTDAFTYTIGDGIDTSVAAIVNVTVSAVHDAPVASNATLTLEEDHTGLVFDISNYIEAGDAEVLADAYTIVSQPGQGSLNGTVYTPNTNFNGLDAITFKVTDTSDADSNTATLTFNVTPVHDAPVASNGSITTSEDHSGIAIDFSSFVVAGDASILDDAYNIVSQPGHGSFNGMTYTPDANFYGIDSFTFKATDTFGVVSNVATITLTVTAVHDAPIASNATLTLEEDHTGLTFDISNYIEAGDAEVLADAYTIGSQPGQGSLNGMVYTPNANFNGLDTISFKVTDTSGAESNEAILTFNITTINDLPIASDDILSIARTSSPLYLTANDSDVDHALSTMTINIQSQPLNGVLSISNTDVTYLVNSDSQAVSDSFTYSLTDPSGGDSSVAQVELTISDAVAPTANLDVVSVMEDSANNPFNITNNDSGERSFSAIEIVNPSAHGSTTIDGLSVIYTPDSNYSGMDTFTYRVTDSQGLQSSNASVDIEIIAINDQPIARDDEISVSQGMVKTFNPLLNDEDDSESLTINIVSQPLKGIAMIEGNLIKYTPNPDLTFTADALGYTVTDNEGLTSLSATVSINMVDAISAPSALNDTFVVELGTTPELELLDNDTFNTTNTTITIIEDVTLGTLYHHAGMVEYQASQPGNTWFTYTITDDLGQISNTATVNITITESVIIKANDDFVSVNEDTTKVINLTANDVFTEVSSLSIDDVPSLGEASVDSHFNVTYTPYNNIEGTDSFVYTIIDVNGEESQATVFITIIGDYADLLTVDDNVSLAEDESASVNVLFNDSLEIDDNFEVIIKVQPVNGVAMVNANASISYTPNTNFNGTDTVIYSVKNMNNQVESNAAIVTFNIDAVNDTPIANADSYYVDSGRTITLSILDNDTDVDSNIDNLTIVFVKTSDHGVLVVEGNAISYTAPDYWEGAVTLEYYVSDGSNAQSDSAMVDIHITNTQGKQPSDDDSKTLDDAFNNKKGGGAPGIILLALGLLLMSRKK